MNACYRTAYCRPALVGDAISARTCSGTVLETKVNHIHANPLRRGLVNYKSGNDGGVADSRPPSARSR
jgi:hypothetical protein